MQIHSSTTKAMRQVLLCLFVICSSLILKAGEHDWHLGLSPSVLLNLRSRTVRYGGSISLEKQISSRRAIEFNLMATGKRNMGNLIKNSELLLQGYYKPILSLGKNSYSHFKFGPNLGFGPRGLLFGLGAGFEYNIVFRNRVKFFISQDNILVFRGYDRFSSGISLGLKLPL